MDGWQGMGKTASGADDLPLLPYDPERTADWSQLPEGNLEPSLVRDNSVESSGIVLAQDRGIAGDEQGLAVKVLAEVRDYAGSSR